MIYNLIICSYKYYLYISNLDRYIEKRNLVISIKRIFGAMFS